MRYIYVTTELFLTSFQGCFQKATMRRREKDTERDEESFDETRAWWSGLYFFFSSSSLLAESCQTFHRWRFHYVYSTFCTVFLFLSSLSLLVWRLAYKYIPFRRVLACVFLFKKNLRYKYAHGERRRVAIERPTERRRDMKNFSLSWTIFPTRRRKEDNG